MSAKLHIKGMKEPIDLSEEEGKVAERFILDPSKPPETSFSIEGVWAGRKADMRYVAFEKKEQRRENVSDKHDREMKEHLRDLLALDPKDRASECLPRFRLSWFARSGMVEKELPPDIEKEVLQIATEYFRANPHVALVPFEITEPVLIKRWGKKSRV